MVNCKCCFSARSQGGVKIGHGGPLLKKNSSDPKATATNRMHSIDLEARAKKMFLFLVPFRSQILYFSHFCVHRSQRRKRCYKCQRKVERKINYRSKIVVITCTYISSTCLSKFLSNYQNYAKTHKIL